MKVAIVGSRNFIELGKVRQYVCALPSDTIVVSGGARGVDAVAEKTAKARGLKTIVYLADWSKGKSAGMKRNTDIINEADRVVAFWDGHSRGTADSINKAKKAGKPVTVIYDCSGK